MIQGEKLPVSFREVFRVQRGPSGAHHYATFLAMYQRRDTRPTDIQTSSGPAPAASCRKEHAALRLVTASKSLADDAFARSVWSASSEDYRVCSSHADMKENASVTRVKLALGCGPKAPLTREPLAP